MLRRRLMLATVITVILSGCGGAEEIAAPEPPAASAAAPTTADPPAAEPTAEPPAAEPTTAEPSDDETTDDETVAGAPAPEPPAGAVETDEVQAVDFAFTPVDIVVPAGTTVTFTNEDSARHTVTAGTPTAPEPDVFDLELPGAGSSVTFTFDEPGTYAYFCEPHPFMRGTVTVTG